MPDLVRMWYGKKPTVTFNPNIETVEHIEGFEDWPTVNPWFTVANPAPGYTYGWTENTNPAFVKTGTRSIKNVPISHNQKAGIAFTVNIPQEAKYAVLTFDYFQDAEDFFDELLIYLDGVLHDPFFADVKYGEWGTYTLFLPPGQHTITFEYSKDESGSEGTDSVYIDNLRFAYWTDTSAAELFEGFERWPTVNTRAIYTVTNPGSGYTTGWEENTDPAFVKTGVKSLKNANLSQPGKAGIDFTVLIPHSARYAFLVFDYYQDCDSTVGDGLFVYVNGVNKIVPDDGVYGSWATHNLALDTGQNKITFEYWKDATAPVGTDSVYIDNVRLIYVVDQITETPGDVIVPFDGSEGYHLMYHRVGAQAPPINFIEHRVPFRAGSRHQHTDIQPRNIELGILVKASSPSELRDKVRELTNKLINVDGALYALYSDGTERRLYCRYLEGLEGEEKKETMGAGYFQKLVLVFRAFDPFWYVWELTGYEHYALMNKDYNKDGIAEGYSSLSSGTITYHFAVDPEENAQKIEVISSGSAGAWASVYREVNTTAGNTYSLQVEVKTKGAVEGRFYVSWYGETGSLGKYTDFGYVPPNTDWATYKIPNQVAPEGATIARVYFQAYCRNGGETGIVWFRKAQWEASTTATDFTTSPRKNILVPYSNRSLTDRYLAAFSNYGSYDIYPVIYVDGPINNPSIVIFKHGESEPAVGSGKRLRINYSVPAGRRLIVDMGKRTVKLDDGTNLYRYLDQTDRAFTLIPNDREAYNIDVDHSGTFGTVQYHVYAEEPHWGV